MQRNPAFVLFRVDASLLAVRLGAVEHVLWMVELIPIPAAPHAVSGIMNYRGRYLPVLDVRRRLGGASRPFVPGDRLIVATAGGRGLALAVDSVEGVLEVPAESIQPITWASAATPHLASVIHGQEQAVLIQDIDSWLSADDEAQLREILGRLQPVREAGA